MRPILLIAATVVAATAAPNACLSQVYYQAMPYTASYAPTYWTYSPGIVEPPAYTTAYYPAPQPACACQPASVPYNANRPVAPARPVQKPTYRSVDGRGNYTVFANAGQIYAADSRGQVWRLDGNQWNQASSGPIPD